MQSTLRDEATLEKLSNVLGDVFSIVATLSRSSRSISIGLRNHDHEACSHYRAISLSRLSPSQINVTEFLYAQRVQKIRKEIEELSYLSKNADAIELSAREIREMRGVFVVAGSRGE